MSKPRATWNSRYEKGLVDIMRDHVNIPLFRGQNGWSGEGWRSISEKFTQMYPLARLTKQQLQEKEKELKGSWKAIHVALKDSGVGWNDSLAMVIAEPEKWKKLINDNGKWLGSRRSRFLYMKIVRHCMLEELGWTWTSLSLNRKRSVATGDLNFTSTEHLQPAPLVPIAAPAALATPAAPAAPVAVSDSTSPGATFDGLDVPSARNEAQFAPSNQDSMQGASSGRKHKQSHIGAAIDGFVQFKKMQTSKTMEALNEKKKQDEAFSVDKCLDEVDAMELIDVETAYVMNIFKSEIDREVFMKMKNKNVLLSVEAMLVEAILAETMFELRRYQLTELSSTV
ncbi:uncharacterized protein [Miscanthus floridulus]|uniref:uncharacterized protein n=1 Tax=Miscanthus floridulus TaxID=154761 RepID=UPI0034589564